MNKIPATSNVRRICEVIAAHGPMTHAELAVELPNLSYNTLKNSRQRAMARGSLEQFEDGKRMWRITRFWELKLDACAIPMHTANFIRFASPVPKHHPLLACWAKPIQGATA
jgi:hypothetical protein